MSHYLTVDELTEYDSGSVRITGFILKAATVECIAYVRTEQ